MVILQDYLFEIIQGLEAAVNELVNKSFQNSLLVRFLVRAYSNYSYSPNEFFYRVELQKLSFSTTGALKNNSQDVLEFLIGMYFIFHILVREILYNSNHSFPDISGNAEEVFEQIGGYIYHFFVIGYSKEIPDIPNNTEVIKNQDNLLEPCTLPPLIYGISILK